MFAILDSSRIKWCLNHRTFRSTQSGLIQAYKIPHAFTVKITHLLLPVLHLQLTRGQCLIKPIEPVVCHLPMASHSTRNNVRSKLLEHETFRQGRLRSHPASRMFLANNNKVRCKSHAVLNRVFYIRESRLDYSHSCLARSFCIVCSISRSSAIGGSRTHDHLGKVRTQQ